MRILNFGSLNIDYTYNVARFVQTGETIEAADMHVNVGGKGLNQSISIARSGGGVYHAGCVGQDGDMLLTYLKENGVDTTYIKKCDLVTGNAFIQVDAVGQNCILVYGGANKAVTPDYVDFVLQHFSAEDVVLLQNEISCVSYIMEAAHKKGMKVVLNPSPVQGLSEVWKSADLLLLNEHEAAFLFGTNDLDRICQQMSVQFPAEFVLTLGQKGAVYIRGEDCIQVPAVKVKAVDTTAAGDTFTGYFLTSYFRGEKPQTALETAAKAAAVAVSRRGAAQSIPYYDEL